MKMWRLRQEEKDKMQQGSIADRRPAKLVQLHIENAASLPIPWACIAMTTSVYIHE